MSKKLGYIICAILALSPCASKADFDPLSFAQDQLSNYNDEINKMVNDYIGYELNAMQLVNSRDKLGDLKKMGKKYMMDKAVALGSGIEVKKIRTLTLSGIGNQIIGEFSTPQLEKTIGKKMTRKSMVSNDVLQARQHNEEINELQRENVATMYAKALVRRKQLINEGKRLEEEEKQEMTDLTLIKDAYKVVSSRANGRWKSMLDSAANYQAQLGTAHMLSFRIVDEEEDEPADDGAQGARSRNNNSKKKGFSLTDAYNSGKNLKNNVEDGNYAGALGTLSGATGGLGEENASHYLKTAQGAYGAGTRAANDAERGDWTGMATGIAGSSTNLAGEYVDGNTRNILNDVNRGVNTGADVADTFSGDGNALDKGNSIWDSLANTAEGLQSTSNTGNNQQPTPNNASSPSSSTSAPSAQPTGGNNKNKNFVWGGMNDAVNAIQPNNSETDTNKNNIPDMFEVTPAK